MFNEYSIIKVLWYFKAWKANVRLQFYFFRVANCDKEASVPLSKAHDQVRQFNFSVCHL